LGGVGQNLVQMAKLSLNKKDILKRSEDKIQNLQYNKQNKLKPVILRTYSRDNLSIKVLNNEEVPVDNRVNSAKMIGQQF
jgi:hypothetical protein